ncbi:MULTISPECIES: RnfABCDGE type electron transport complex subunit D [Aminobacterium]|jgi:electron transport complex protein RnfD|uniref:RnfABCDGE type electron transport complex subunit D n=1 Tax=Aminobacterium TaxID=81466 RepID=UPI002580BEE4|nr:RnfABCDGE type electron transport complex subunit D [Aminobacterium sp. UBA4987]
MTEKKLVVASSPHFRAHATVQTIMGDVLIALAPALAAALYFFGFKAFTVIAVCVLASVVSEAAWQKLMGHPQTIKDLSAVVTGLLLAFNLPPTVPLWLAAFGSIFAIIVVKHFFGGIGQNIVNPALAARAMLLASWPVAMTTWAVDGMTTATPLALLKEGTAAILPTLSDVFIGHVGGCLGETSVLALLLGGAYLLWRKVISWHIPVIYISTVFVLTALLGREGWMTGNPLYEIFLGGLMVGAFFMATDYTTSPMTKKGQVIFASGCGILTTLIRLYGGYAEGVSYSILIMNLFVPLIDRVTVPRIFGEVR